MFYVVKSHLIMSLTSSDEVKPEDIHNLLEHCVKTAHKVKDGDIEVT